MMTHYITLEKGNRLLMINGYSFSKNSRIAKGGIRYACSSLLTEKCKAYAHVSVDNVILKCHTEHNHSPIQYIRTSNGRYIKVFSSKKW
ncbi:hypothetical protein HW555_009352 [Spodoptera exigua]|uniref:FLYWCH-type domain-containing protein n=1 Tax=Spodoptera exigua TaxID=7107 RepID=A0A835GCM5_SPOEX|nr:hypothetical protein HW555_009352 [Spodoptera exigua]